MKQLILLVAIGLMSTEAFSQRNAYDDFDDVIDDAKWQLGDPQQDICERDECDGAMNNERDLVFSQSGYFWFSSDGSKSEDWRSELRFLDSFRRNNTRSMSARVGNFNHKNSSDSEGYTIAQLHKEQASGPPARLEFIDSDSMEVTFRRDESCSGSSCFNHVDISNSASGWKDVLLSLRSRVLTVSVNGTSRSFNLDGSNGSFGDGTWNNNRRYYWKAGIYFQDSGSALVAFDNLNW